jgi:hypothetical protein
MERRIFACFILGHWRRTMVAVGMVQGEEQDSGAERHPAGLRVIRRW